jgi:hypothetical protein
MQRLKSPAAQMPAAPDQQISLTDPDSRSMATSGQGLRVVGYNVQVAVDTKHHLIVVHEVINIGNDRSRLARIVKATKATLGIDSLDVVADRGHFDSEEILAREESGHHRHAAQAHDLRCQGRRAIWQAGLRLCRRERCLSLPSWRATDLSVYERRNRKENASLLDHSLSGLLLKLKCTTDRERQVPRWEHEHVFETVQRRFDENPQKSASAPRDGRASVRRDQGPGGSHHFLTKTLPKVASEMALSVRAYNLTRVVNIVGV